MSGFDYGAVAGQGTDTIDRSVLGMPFINMIQKGSPEFDETHPKFTDKQIEGAKPGDILFEPERAILSKPVRVVPLASTTLYTEWKPNKGGFAGNRQLDIKSHNDYRRGEPGSKQQYAEYLGQNDLVLTIYVMMLFFHEDKWKQGMIAFTSTQLKVARSWSRAILNTKLPEFPDIVPPIFASAYSLSTFADSNAKGGYFSWVITRDGILSAETDQKLLETASTAASAAIKSLPQGTAPQQAAIQEASTTTEVTVEEQPF